MTERDEKECEVLGRALLDKHGLHDWSISFENLHNALYDLNGDMDFLGICDFGRGDEGDLWGKTIRIDHTTPRRQFRQTMLHEIAHALCGKPELGEGHNLKWAETAYRIGCSFIHVLKAHSADERRARAKKS